MPTSNLTSIRCKDNPSLLIKDQISAIAKEIPMWQVKSNRKSITRTFKFHDYNSTLDFVTHAAELAEAENHHPEITFGWGYATVQLYTHKVKGLTGNDFIMAAKLDDYYQESCAD